MRFKLSPPVSSALMHLYLGTYGAVRLNLDRQRLLNAGFLRNSSPSAELPLGLLAGSRWDRTAPLEKKHTLWEVWKSPTCMQHEQPGLSAAMPGCSGREPRVSWVNMQCKSSFFLLLFLLMKDCSLVGGLRDVMKGMWGQQSFGFDCLHVKEILWLSVETISYFKFIALWIYHHHHHHHFKAMPPFKALFTL